MADRFERELEYVIIIIIFNYGQLADRQQHRELEHAIFFFLLYLYWQTSLNNCIIYLYEIGTMSGSGKYKGSARKDPAWKHSTQIDVLSSDGVKTTL